MLQENYSSIGVITAARPIQKDSIFYLLNNVISTIFVLNCGKEIVFIFLYYCLFVDQSI